MITVTAENVRLRPEDSPQNLEGDLVALTIADTGCGIAADILSKVFDPFFTTKQRTKGTGLGLSQVHGFAHQSGGTVIVRSELGKGTSVTLYLPRAQAGPRREAREPAVESSGSGTALLVEDNPDVAEVSVALLEQLGYQVHAAGDALTALEAVEARKFDLVVSDIVMAGAMDGLGLARAIRQRHPDLPVILVTGYSDTAALAAPEFAVLRKPYQLAELSRAAAKVIAETRQPPPGNLVRLRDARRGGRPKNERPYGFAGRNELPHRHREQPAITRQDRSAMRKRIIRISGNPRLMTYFILGRPLPKSPFVGESNVRCLSTAPGKGN